MAIGFNADVYESKRIQDEMKNSIGKYVILYTSNSSQFSGKLKAIQSGKTILNPFQTTDYSENNKPLKKLIKEDLLILESITAIAPTTKKNLEGFCKYEPEKDKEEKPSKD